MRTARFLTGFGAGAPSNLPPVPALKKSLKYSCVRPHAVYSDSQAVVPRQGILLLHTRPRRLQGSVSFEGNAAER